MAQAATVDSAGGSTADPDYWRTTGDSYPSMKSDIEEAESVADNSSKIKIRLQDIQDAHSRIKKDILVTPVVEAKYVGRKFCNVFFKLENLQFTGSFKARGACSVISMLTHSERSKGCTITGGRNFLLAMTYYGHKASVPMNLVVPRDCPIVDRQRFRENYAVVKVYGNDQNDASLHALSYSEEIGTKHIHGCDRLDLMAGYGTIGLELMSQIDRVDAIICPLGSGGLIASLIVAVKSLKPKVLIYGAECASCPVMTRALQEKKPTIIQMNATIADSLQHTIASINAYNVIRSYLDKILTVDERMISRAMIMLLEREKLIVEGAAACSVAALMGGRAPELAGKNVVCIVSGGNVNSMRMARVIDRGLAAEGRLVKFMATLPDVPGAMARLLVKVGETGADVRSMVPERTWMKRDIFSMSVNMVIETSDARHAKDVERKLMKEYPHSHFVML